MTTPKSYGEAIARAAACFDAAESELTRTSPGIGSGNQPIHLATRFDVHAMVQCGFGWVAVAESYYRYGRGVQDD